MAALTVPRIMVAGATKGAGKSITALGLVYELRRRGLSVSVCTTNSNLAISIIFRRIAGRYVRCIDPRLLSPSQILETLYQASLGADVLIIDGSGALYDGVGAGSFEASDAEVASLTRTPTVLVVDGRNMGNSAAAVVKGYSYYAQGFEFLGALMNRIHEEDQGGGGILRDRQFYEDVMGTMRVSPLVGGMAEATFDVPELPERISQEFNFGALPRQFFVGLNSLINRAMDVDEVLELARRAPVVEVPGAQEAASSRQCRIAVADDVCFGMCFQDNLDLLRYHGAELVSFSPVADQTLPQDIGGLYLPGGYLDEYGRDLTANAGMIDQIREFAERKGALYAEGASVAFLCERYRTQDPEGYYPGARVIKTSAEFQPEQVAFCDAAVTDDSVVSNAGAILKGITTNRWKLAQEIPILKTMQVGRQYQRTIGEGYAPYFNCLASFCFWHWGSGHDFARCFIDAARP